MRSKRAFAALMACVMCMQMGCGKTENVKSDISTAAGSSDVRAESDAKAESDVTADSVAKQEGSLSVSDADVSLSGVSATSETEEEEKKAIVLPEGQDLKFDYTTVEGITVEPGTTIAVVVKNTDNIFYKEVKKGAERAIEEINEAAGLKGKEKVSLLFMGADDSTDIDDQINMLDEVLQENPDALCLAAIDMNSCTAQLETAADNAIPVVILDSGVKSHMVDSICSTDNYSMGAAAAEKMLDAVDGNGKILVLSHLTESETASERIKGFKEKMAELNPEIEIVDVTPEDEEESLTTALDEAMKENTDVCGIFSANIEYVAKTQEYLNKQKIENLPMICIDCDEAQKKAIEDGIAYGSFCQNPYTMGYVSVTAALHAIAGEEIDENIDTGYLWVDRTNVDTPEAQAYMIDE